MRMSWIGRCWLLLGITIGMLGGPAVQTVFGIGFGWGCSKPQCSSCDSCDLAPAPDDMAADTPIPLEDPMLSPSRFAALASSSVAISDSNVGYIDSAVIGTNFRARFDAAYGMSNSDRAGFMYSTWNQFGGSLPDPPNGSPDPDVDFQSFALYFEYALNHRLSIFAEGAAASHNLSVAVNGNPSGIGDTIVGFKLGLWDCPNKKLTFQLKNYLPTGDDGDWQGLGHYSIEPGLLYYQALSDRLTMESELRVWIPIGGAVDNNGNNYSGTVMRYGVGMGYDLNPCSRWVVTPIVELVGWSVLDGQVFDFTSNTPIDATGDTIVNIKLGARIGSSCGGDIYAGYGRALTGDSWYQDIYRLEYRRSF